MPIRGIILMIVFAAIIAWFCRDEIYAWIKKQRGKDTKDEENEDDEE